MNELLIVSILLLMGAQFGIALTATVIVHPILLMAKKTTAFEKDFSKSLKSKYSLMVNSGSSANLLALQCLINPYRKYRLKKGDEVIIPTLCWSTSLWPIIQSNLKPVFVDINPLSLNIDENEIEKKLIKKLKLFY